MVGTKLTRQSIDSLPTPFTIMVGMKHVMTRAPFYNHGWYEKFHDQSPFINILALLTQFKELHLPEF
jgi:hypothetical protein